MECKGDSVEKVGSRSLKKNDLAVFDPQIDCVVRLESDYPYTILFTNHAVAVEFDHARHGHG